ncbi:Melanopsin-A Mammalian-like melanopsin [Takifugu flavidus]|uniref:Melanopsin-A Mammalian-like melanopsin n=1 Tax=Takifugu flavidus TaxID=433684 RepID=A0A5C6PTN4_9TELE|nr:Melanopsin-A Mammalian-like melanopsin [Takifugu flavidus]
MMVILNIVLSCELYAFCGALFGICSMMTLMVIAVDRYMVITRPLASLGVMSRRKALSILAVTWVYSMGWSLPPFFGWSAYVPEGLMTSCSWDYMTFTPSVRSYTMLLFTFVFFIPLSIIIFSYCCIFRAIRHATRAISKINREGSRDSGRRLHKMKSEWKMAKIALIVILLFVISWAPYSCAALTAFAGKKPGAGPGSCRGRGEERRGEERRGEERRGEGRGGRSRGEERRGEEGRGGEERRGGEGRGGEGEVEERRGEEEERRERRGEERRGGTEHRNTHKNTLYDGYAELLTPYMNSVPAVIAKSSAIYNPIVYAITHPKYSYLKKTQLGILGRNLEQAQTPAGGTCPCPGDGDGDGGHVEHLKMEVPELSEDRRRVASSRLAAVALRNTAERRRSALSKYVPYLGALLCMTGRERSSSSSFQSTRRSTLTSQSDCRGHVRARNSSASESESARFSDMEDDCLPRMSVGHQLSSNGKQVRHSSQRSKVRGHGSGRFERTSTHKPTELLATVSTEPHRFDPVQVLDLLPRSPFTTE